MIVLNQKASPQPFLEVFRKQNVENQELVPASAIDVLEVGQEHVQDAFQRTHAAQQQLIDHLRAKLSLQAEENEALQQQLANAQSHVRSIQTVHQAEVNALQQQVKTMQGAMEQLQQQNKIEVSALQQKITVLESKAQEEQKQLDQMGPIIRELRTFPEEGMICFGPPTSAMLRYAELGGKLNAFHDKLAARGNKS